MTTPARAAAVARLVASRERWRQGLAAEAARPGLQQTLGLWVQRHPLLLATAAMVVGGWLVRVRPWQGLLRPGGWAAICGTLLPVAGPALASALSVALSSGLSSGLSSTLTPWLGSLLRGLPAGVGADLFGAWAARWRAPANGMAEPPAAGSAA